MTYTRKDFLKSGVGIAGALAFSPLLRSLTLIDDTRRLKRFGIQLYMVRDLFEKDPKGTLKQIAALGYKQVESYERATGIYWGMNNLDFKKYMDDLDMTIISSHCDIDMDFERKAAEAAAIGIKYLVAAWEGQNLSIEDYKRYAEKLNEKGKVCKQNGIGFAFHNHWFSFQKNGAEIPQDVLMNNTDASLVDFELDIYWAVAAGQDPELFLKKYPNRFRLCHVKDRVKGTTKMEDTCDLGTGSIDFSAILKTARKNGTQYFFAEQEHYPNSTPMKSAEVAYAYLKQLSI